MWLLKTKIIKASATFWFRNLGHVLKLSFIVSSSVKYGQQYVMRLLPGVNKLTHRVLSTVHSSQRILYKSYLHTLIR